MTAELKTAMDFVKAYDQDRGAFLEDMEAACIAFAKHHCTEFRNELISGHLKATPKNLGINNFESIYRNVRDNIK